MVHQCNMNFEQKVGCERLCGAGVCGRMTHDARERVLFSNSCNRLAFTVSNGFNVV